MSAVDVETFKLRAEEFVTRAIAGEATIIERNGRRAVLMPCEGEVPDFELYPKADALLTERLKADGGEATSEDWATLRRRLSGE